MSERTGVRLGDPYSGRQPTSHERRARQPWDASYLDGPPAWDVGPQPAILRLAREGAFAGAILDADFVVGDALHLDVFGRVFETVLDCGLFHTFDGDERRDYVAGLAAVTGRGGWLYVLCFSDVGPDASGPHPVSERELRAAFTARGGWRVSSVDPDRIHTTFAAQGVPAWLARIERISSPDRGPVDDPLTQ